MKLAFTISDAGHAIHVGGQTTSETHVVEIPDYLIPKAVLGYLENRDNSQCFWSMSVSVVVETDRNREQAAVEAQQISAGVPQ